MITRIQELEAAASAINPASLEAAKIAVTEDCEEYLRWAALFSKRLESINHSEFHRFARALALIMLGNLPTKPSTCPFCIQYGRDRSCQGCGYAQIHGRCDSDDSSFCLFIEAFLELGRVIYQDVWDYQSEPVNAQPILKFWLDHTIQAARRMKDCIGSASTISAYTFMEQKAQYLDEMLSLIPLSLFSNEVTENCLIVRESLLDYW
ncbi:MAG: hypothetical protein NTW84_02525 [Methanothrix sp.]|nr:hypothetical protein [Methanothrix sp.]